MVHGYFSFFFFGIFSLCSRISYELVSRFLLCAFETMVRLRGSSGVSQEAPHLAKIFGDALREGTG